MEYQYLKKEQFYPTDEPTKITKDLLQIIRDIHYTITDKALFDDVPKNEKDVHIRIEGILNIDMLISFLIQTMS